MQQSPASIKWARAVANFAKERKLDRLAISEPERDTPARRIKERSTDPACQAARLGQFARHRFPRLAVPGKLNSDERQCAQFTEVNTAIRGCDMPGGIDNMARQRAAREPPQAADRNLGAAALCELSCTVFEGVKDLFTREHREEPITLEENKQLVPFDGIDPAIGPGNHAAAVTTASSSSLARSCIYAAIPACVMLKYLWVFWFGISCSV